MTNIYRNTFIIFIFLFTSSASFADSDALQAVWDDPEYQLFVEALKPWVQPLTEEEQNLSTAELTARAGGQFGLSLISVMPLFLEIGNNFSSSALIDWNTFLYTYEERKEWVQNQFKPSTKKYTPLQGKKTHLATTVIPQVEEFIRLAGNIYIDKNKLKEMSIADFSDGLFFLGLAGSIKYVTSLLNLEPSAKHTLYDWASLSFELPEIYFPKHPSLLKYKMGLPLLRSILQISAPLKERLPKHYTPITNKDIAWLRSRLPKLMKKVSFNNFSKLKGGLPGHSSKAVVEDFILGNNFPYLILFYRPDDYRHANFNCTRLEKLLTESKRLVEKGFSCNPRMVELMLFNALLKKAGDGQSSKQTNDEQFYVTIFTVKHYGDILEILIPGINYPELVRQLASMTIKTVELVDELLASPANKLNFFEKLTKMMLLNIFQNKNDSQSHQFVSDLKIFLKQ